MKVSRVVLAAYFAIIALLLTWGTWLLLTHDPDGGRHPVGAAMLVVSFVSAVPGVVALRRAHRRAR